MRNQAQIDQLNDLLAIEHDLVESYELAIARLEAEVDKQHLTEYSDDHRRRVAHLARAIEDRQGTPAARGQLHSILTKGKMLCGSLIGDQALLRELRTIETDAHNAHTRAIERHPELRSILEHGSEVEHKHLTWLIQRLGVLEQVMQP